MNNLRIGITIDTSHIDCLWVNGLHLNVMYFLKLLKKSKNNYKVCLLYLRGKEMKQIPPHLQGVDVFCVDDKLDDLDVIITMGSEIEHHTIQKFKSKPGKKIISYRCGNSYVLAAEKILFKPNDNTWFTHESTYDEIWYVPQQHESNHGYYKTLYRTNAIPVPFMWDNQYLLEAARSVESEFKKGNYKKNFGYDPTKSKKAIGVMEPNNNTVKYCLIPAMIAEQCYRGETGKNRIEKLLLGSAKRIAKDKTFLSILKTFDLFKDGKVTAEDRYQTAFILTQHIDILVSHQILNPLNYLYMDAAYFGYPVLHNAWMCKDVGYYYEGSDIIDGANKLQWIIEHHDNHRKEYADRNGKALYRFSIENPKILETYDMLFDNLVRFGTNGDRKYDPDANTYME